MAADVENGVNSSIRMPRQDHLLGGHAKDFEIVRLGDDALMRDAMPVAAEDALQITLVDILVPVERPGRPWPGL
jgi:hypothetical protein